MRKPLVPLLIVAATLMAGCTKEKTGNPSPADLSAALLTVTDMPAGWNETQRQVFDKRANENPSIDPSVWCAAAAEESKDLVALAGDAGADVEMEWTAGKGPRMMRLQAWSNDDVQDYYHAAKESADECDGTTSTDADGVTSESHVIAGRDILDQSFSWSEKRMPPAGAGAAKFESVSRTTVARHGKVIMVLQLGDAAPVGTSTLMPEDDWWQIVQLAANKLKTASE